MDKAAMQRWASRTEREVTLPSGQRAKVVVPAPEALLRNDAMPQDLRAMVLRFSTGGINVQQLDADGMATYLALQQELTAMCLRQLYDEDTSSWQPIRLTADDVRVLDLPQEDLTALESIAVRRLTPNQVTITSRYDLGLVTAEDKAKVDKEEAGATVTGYATFRDQQRGTGAGADSADVRPESSTDIHGHNGPSAGAGAG